MLSVTVITNSVWEMIRDMWFAARNPCATAQEPKIVMAKRIISEWQTCGPE